MGQGGFVVCKVATFRRNNSNTFYNLGVIYERDELVSRDIYKAIHYYSLAAEQNESRVLQSKNLKFNFNGNRSFN